MKQTSKKANLWAKSQNDSLERQAAASATRTATKKAREKNEADLLAQVGLEAEERERTMLERKYVLEGGL